MSNGKLAIIPVENGVIFEAAGRANFETAMPLREYAAKLSGTENIWFSLADCTMFDSTFMGVMAMIALKAKRQGHQAMLFRADGKLCALLNGIGILKLFAVAESLPAASGQGESPQREAGTRSEAERAKVVLDAHRTLVEADARNGEVFRSVIDFAAKDVDRLTQGKKEESK